MQNRFEATCTRCGLPVLPGQGDTNLHNGRWLTTHNTCPQPSSLLHELDGEMYAESGMTAGDWKDALNPDEGDK